MFKFLLYITFFTILISCGASKTISNDERNDEDTVDQRLITNNIDSLDKFNVQIKIQNYHPYCGGMAPTPEMLENRYSPASGTFILIDLNTGERKNVRTDNFGVVNLNLPNGRYALKETYKDVSFQKFIDTYSDTTNRNIINGDEECYKNWWSSYLSSFEIIDDSTIIKHEITLSSSCFVGINQCQQYMGPYPP